jgi:alkylation response protein AidB-like acyl-CoA dehydrogenase
LAGRLRAGWAAERGMSVDELQAEVSDWLRDHWDDERPLFAWRGMLADAGWGCPTWPTQWWGRGLSPGRAAIVEQEFFRFGSRSLEPRCWSTGPMM